jgi:hypothetical protein
MGEICENSENVVRKFLENSTCKKADTTLPAPTFQPDICMRSVEAERMQ